VLDVVIDHIAERVAQRLAALIIGVRQRRTAMTTSGSTRGTQRATSRSTATRFANWRLSGPFRPSRTGRTASCISDGGISMLGGSPADGRGIWQRRCRAPRRCPSWVGASCRAGSGSNATSTVAHRASTRSDSKTRPASSVGARWMGASPRPARCATRCSRSARAASGCRTMVGFASAMPLASGLRARGRPQASDAIVLPKRG
jgi:hypothetical protein